MKITKLIEQLEIIKKHHGDIEVTCTAALIPDCPNTEPFPKVFETTVENLRVFSEERVPSRSGKLGDRVRLYL